MNMPEPAIQRGTGPYESGEEDRIDINETLQTPLFAHGPLNSSGRHLEPIIRNSFSGVLDMIFPWLGFTLTNWQRDLQRPLQADAYTFGSDIVFAKGRYAPDSRDGRHLLAHELAHTVQQGASSQLNNSDTPSATPHLHQSPRILALQPQQGHHDPVRNRIMELDEPSEGNLQEAINFYYEYGTKLTPEGTTLLTIEEAKKAEAEGRVSKPTVLTIYGNKTLRYGQTLGRWKVIVPAEFTDGVAMLDGLFYYSMNANQMHQRLYYVQGITSQLWLDNQHINIIYGRSLGILGKIIGFLGKDPITKFVGRATEELGVAEEEQIQDINRKYWGDQRES